MLTLRKTHRKCLGLQTSSGEHLGDVPPEKYIEIPKEACQGTVRSLRRSPQGGEVHQILVRIQTQQPGAPLVVFPAKVHLSCMPIDVALCVLFLLSSALMVAGHPQVAVSKASKQAIEDDFIPTSLQRTQLERLGGTLRPDECPWT